MADDRLKKKGLTGTGPITVARRGRRGTWRIARERDDERRETRGSGRFARGRSGPPPAEIARASRSARPTVRRVAFGRADLAVGGRHNGAKLCTFLEFYAVCVLSQRTIVPNASSNALPSSPQNDARLRRDGGGSRARTAPGPSSRVPAPSRHHPSNPSVVVPRASLVSSLVVPWEAILPGSLFTPRRSRPCPLRSRRLPRVRPRPRPPRRVCGTRDTGTPPRPCREVARSRNSKTETRTRTV